VWARARIAELETAMLNHTRSLRQTELPPGSFKFPSVYQHEGGFLENSSSSLPIPPIELEYVDKQQGAVMVEELLQQRGILRELLRAELRDIAKGRKGQSSGSRSVEVCCPTPSDNATLNTHSVASSGKQCSMLLAEHKAELEIGSPRPSVVVPHPPSHSPELEAEEDMQTLQRYDPYYGKSDVFLSGDGSAQEISSQADQQSSQQLSRVLIRAGCDSSSFGGVEPARMDGRYKNSGEEARNCLESPKYCTTKSESSVVAQQRVGEACSSQAVVLGGAADGPNDLVRIISRRNGGRLRRSNRSWDDTVHSNNG
jgi:hypothetical protein